MEFVQRKTTEAGLPSTKSSERSPMRRSPQTAELSELAFSKYLSSSPPLLYGLMPPKNKQELNRAWHSIDQRACSNIGDAGSNCLLTDRPKRTNHDCNHYRRGRQGPGIE